MGGGRKGTKEKEEKIKKPVIVFLSVCFQFSQIFYSFAKNEDFGSRNGFAITIDVDVRTMDIRNSLKQFSIQENQKSYRRRIGSGDSSRNVRP